MPDVSSPFGRPPSGPTPFLPPPVDSRPATPSPFGASDVGEDARRVVAAMDLPRGFVLDTSADALDIRWRWWTPAHVFILVFAGFWDLFMVVWYTMAIAGGQWMMAAFGTLHALVGAGLAYWAVAGLVNHTTVSIRPRHVSVAHGPLPWPGVRPLPREEVDQLYVSRQELRNKGSVQVTFEVRVVRRDGSELALVRGLTSADQASFLEARIEAALGIEDRPVPGEHRGGNA